MNRFQIQGILAVILLLVLNAAVVYAQPGDPGGGTDPDAPITGIEYLLGLGALFGVKRILNSFKKGPEVK
jgi:hypothetical protein